jgi:hypothetical protein
MALACATMLWSPAARAETVRLEVTNPSVEPAVRCVVLLAHFYTVDLDRVSPGGVVILDLDRDVETGDLVLYNRTGAAMRVESVVCGKVEDWTRSSQSLPLAALRTGRSLTVTCDASTGGVLRCRPRKTG